MKTQIIRHGEVILKPETLPKNAVLEQSSKKYIVAHSETGHHHVLEAKTDFKIFTFNGERFIEIPTVAELWHQKTGKDVHTPHKVAPSVYKIVIKREFDYFSKALRNVRD